MRIRWATSRSSALIRRTNSPTTPAKAASFNIGAWGVENAHFPLVLGSDGSGTVVARGARVRRFHVGDEVYAYSLGNRKGGFDAEHVAVHGIDDALAIKRNENVVIVGASGKGHLLGRVVLRVAEH